MPTCSACLQPMRTGDKAKIIGTEVFHRRCANQPGQVARAKAKLAGMQREIDRLTAEREVHKQSAQANAIEARRQHEHGDNLARVIEQQRNQLRSAEYREAATEARADRLEAQVQSRDREIARQAGEVTRLAGENLLLQTLARAPSDQPVETADERTDIEKRSSLLELT